MKNEILLALAIILIVALPNGCSYYECGLICDANHDSRMWTYSQGCYCIDAETQEAYNPRDARN